MKNRPLKNHPLLPLATATLSTPEAHSCPWFKTTSNIITRYTRKASNQVICFVQRAKIFKITPSRIMPKKLLVSFLNHSVLPRQCLNTLRKFKGLREFRGLRRLRELCIGVLWIASVTACNAYSPDQTTSILTYPAPRITNFNIDRTTLNGEVAITLNPSINNELREYWLLLASDTSTNFSDIDVTTINDINSLDATQTGATAPLYIPHLFTILGNVNNNFSGRTVGNYSFSTEIIGGSADRFYQIAVRAWGSNDSYAVAYRHNGWIVSESSPPISFYIGYQTNCAFTVTELAATRSGYSHTANPPAAAGGTACSDIIGATPDIIFYTRDYALPDGSSINQLRIDVVAMADPNVRLLATGLTNIGAIIDFSSTKAANYLTQAQHGLGFLAVAGRIFLVRHRSPQYFSKIRIDSLSSTTPREVSITILYTGPNGAGITRF